MLISFFDKYLSTLQIDSMDSTVVVKAAKRRVPASNVEILPSTTTTNSLRDLHFNVAGVEKEKKSFAARPLFFKSPFFKCPFYKYTNKKLEINSYYIKNT